MASIKKFEEFVSEMDRAEEIEADVVAKGTPEVKSEEEGEGEGEGEGGGEGGWVAVVVVAAVVAVIIS